jgi:hypothetical protein
MLFSALYEQLTMLEQLIEKLSPDQFTHKVAELGDASIGQHTRHVIELLRCALGGYEEGVVDYDNRFRDLRIENDKDFASNCINDLKQKVEQPNKLLIIKSRGILDDEPELIPSTYYREILYNIEHIIHHLALIKVGLRCLSLDIVDENFGVAYATIAYRQ